MQNKVASIAILNTLTIYYCLQKREKKLCFKCMKCMHMHEMFWEKLTYQLLKNKHRARTSVKQRIAMEWACMVACETGFLFDCM